MGDAPCRARGEVPLAGVLSRAAAEVGAARAALGRVEAAALALLPTGPPASPAGLQELDRIAQVLDDLGRALEGLAGALPPEARVGAGALATLRLGEMRARLLAPPGAPRSDGGEGRGDERAPPALELF